MGWIREGCRVQCHGREGKKVEEAFREVMRVSKSLLSDGGLSAKGDMEEREE